MFITDMVFAIYVQFEDYFHCQPLLHVLIFKIINEKMHKEF